MLEQALDYARRGWHIVLLRPFSKEPRFYAWQRIKTTDETTIRLWFGRDPQSNIGIATGIESKLVVLDVDQRNGGDASLPPLLERLKLPTPRLRVRTGSGGLHLYFTHPGTVKIASRTGKVGLAPGIELKADGGHYVVAPPSIHPNGNRYEWI